MFRYLRQGLLFTWTVRSSWGDTGRLVGFQKGGLMNIARTAIWINPGHPAFAGSKPISKAKSDIPGNQTQSLSLFDRDSFGIPKLLLSRNLEGRCQDGALPGFMTLHADP